MGYSESIKSVIRVEDFLYTLLTQSGVVKWVVPNPMKLAHLLRQGMYTAAKLVEKDPVKYEQFRKYSQLKFRYKINTTDTEIIATPLDVTLYQKIEIVSDNTHTKVSNALTFNEVATEISVYPNVKEFKFPQYLPTKLEKDRLQKLAMNKGIEIKWMESNERENDSEEHLVQ